MPLQGAFSFALTEEPLKWRLAAAGWAVSSPQTQANARRAQGRLGDIFRDTGRQDADRHRSGDICCRELCRANAAGVGHEEL